MKRIFTAARGYDTLIEFLVEKVYDVSKENLRRQIKAKEVKVDKLTVTDEKKPVFVGASVEIFLPAFMVKEIPAPKVLCSDDNIVVAVKPAGIDSEHNLVDLLKNDFGALTAVHRLDRLTSGIVILARTAEAEKQLVATFKQRLVKKFYLAEVYGHPKKDSATLTAYLTKNAATSLVRITDTPTAGAKEIITSYSVREKKERTAVLNVELITGRTHQIRAHLAHLGHPVVGDGKYGRDQSGELRLTSYKTVLNGLKGSLEYLNGTAFKIDEAGE